MQIEFIKHLTQSKVINITKGTTMSQFELLTVFNLWAEYMASFATFPKEGIAIKRILKYYESDTRVTSFKFNQWEVSLSIIDGKLKSVTSKNILLTMQDIIEDARNVGRKWGSPDFNLTEKRISGDFVDISIKNAHYYLSGGRVTLSDYKEYNSI